MQINLYLLTYFIFKTRQSESCKSLRLQLAYCCLIGNEAMPAFDILDIQQNYAHLVVHRHEAFGPMTVN